MHILIKGNRMKLTDDQRAELREHLEGLGRLCVGASAWCSGLTDAEVSAEVHELLTEDIAPLIESWLSSPPEGWEERIDRLCYVNVQGHEVLTPALFPELATHKRRIWTEPLREAYPEKETTVPHG